jgi:hypothetical protein
MKQTKDCLFSQDLAEARTPPEEPRGYVPDMALEFVLFF